MGVGGGPGGGGVVAGPGGCDMGLVFFHMVPGTWKYSQISPELAACYEMPVFNYRCACKYGPVFPLVGYCGVWGRPPPAPVPLLVLFKSGSAGVS